MQVRHFLKCISVCRQLYPSAELCFFVFAKMLSRNSCMSSIRMTTKTTIIQHCFENLSEYNKVCFKKAIHIYLYKITVYSEKQRESIEKVLEQKGFPEIR